MVQELLWKERIEAAQSLTFMCIEKCVTSLSEINELVSV